MFNYKGNWALITGASAGIGEAFAEELAKKGTNLVLVARRKDRLSSLANKLQETYHVQVDTIPLDLSELTAPQQLFNDVQKIGRRIHLLINNAGVGVYGKLHETDIKKNEQLIILNVFSVAITTQLFLTPMIEDNEGMIINIASTAAFQPLPFMANYGASKAFVLSFTEALWVEYQQHNIRILAVCPGPVATEFFGVMGNEMKSFGKRDTPEVIVKQSLAAVEKDKMYVIPGKMSNYWLAQMLRLVPRKFVAKMTGDVSRKNMSQ